MSDDDTLVVAEGGTALPTLPLSARGWLSLYGSDPLERPPLAGVHGVV